MDRCNVSSGEKLGMTAGDVGDEIEAACESAGINAMPLLRSTCSKIAFEY
jgi:hypothetical protein